jgi:DNA (cytosine-5)-methyltransferase 1
MSAINTLGLFSGGGGLDLGLSSVGYNSVLTSDIDAHSCRTLKENQGKKAYYGKHPVLCQDIRSISYKDIKKIIGNKSINFIVGGPPCQAFSIFGKRQGLKDPRGNLVFEYARLIEEISPEGFLFENVAGLKTIDGGTVYKELLETLSIDGKYTVSAHEYQVAEYGIPQFRKRIIFIGAKAGKRVSAMSKTHTSPEKVCNGYKAYNSVAAVLANMPNPIVDWNGDPKINGHVGRKHSQRIIDRYQQLEFGERDPKTRINRLNPLKPSYTIIVGSDAGGGKGHVHPYESRELTPRESARLQTFPDWWEFNGKGRHIIRQVGNAVPPLFAAILGAHVKKEIFGVNIPYPFEKIVDDLGVGFIDYDNT